MYPYIGGVPLHWGCTLTLTLRGVSLPLGVYLYLGVCTIPLGGVCSLPLGCVPLPKDMHPYLGHSVFQDLLHFQEHSVLLIRGIHFLQCPETSEPLLQLGPRVMERGDPANATNVLT